MSSSNRKPSPDETDLELRTWASLVDAAARHASIQEVREEAHRHACAVDVADDLVRIWRATEPPPATDEGLG